MIGVLRLSWAAAVLLSAAPKAEPVGPVWLSDHPVTTRPSADEALSRACKQEAKRLARRLGKGFQVVVSTPFVLAGDQDRQTLVFWQDYVVGRAAEAMWRTYFKGRPSKPIVILLFSNGRTYRAQAKRLFGDTEVAYYGYFKVDERTLVMNIGTGGGTLIHELTHALMAEDFPDVPDWLDEGLASLHEQCESGAWKRGRLVGDVNWRLPALKRAIRSGELRPLRKLMIQDDFRGPLESLNYAQARYFCMYMQQQGVLVTFYKAFRQGYKEDKTGLSFAEEALGRRRIEAIEQDFLQWVMRLDDER